MVGSSLDITMDCNGWRNNTGILVSPMKYILFSVQIMLYQGSYNNRIEEKCISIRNDYQLSSSMDKTIGVVVSLSNATLK